ncbi:MAG: hypothetical protein ONA90_01695 [candidate division KSB1 bacterium]|nr:hypothetical protein [candidate division KSB1 bacterium]
MIIFEYLLWILFVGYCNFAAIRLMWLYEKVEGHLFWRKPNATTYDLGAILLCVVMLSILMNNFHVFYLLLLLIGEYGLIAASSVKVSDRGIMANAFMARWPEILQAKKINAGRVIVIVTTRSWQWMRLQVPVEKAAAFRKMLAAKGVTIIDEETAKSEVSDERQASTDEMNQQNVTEATRLENLLP